jgi:hypothetical protein
VRSIIQLSPSLIRHSLVAAIVEYNKLAQLVRRAGMIASSNKVVAFGTGLQIDVVCLKDVLSGFSYCLEELVEGVKSRPNLYPMSSFVEAVESNLCTTLMLLDQVTHLLNNMRKSKVALLLGGKANGQVVYRG